MNAMTREQVRAFDRHAIDTLGIPAAVLMENAGRGAAQILQSLGIHGPVVICCGKGNNGGDGLVMARHLFNAGFDVRCLLFADPEELSADAALQWNIVQNLEVPAEIWADDKLDEAVLAAIFAKSEWIVDALFGTGLSGTVREPFGKIIELINASPARVFAVDIPSGLDCDTGAPVGPTICATHTATFVAPKVGFRQPSSLPFTGRVYVIDIGS